MNYLQAKSELLKESPQVPFKLLAIEAAAMIGVALCWCGYLRKR